MALPKRNVKKHLDRDWAKTTVARFPDGASRDGFLRSVAASSADQWEVKPVEDDVRTASVRWRLGHFLVLNDMVYAQHGRIMLSEVRRWA
jgi:hypothetical protein